MPSTPSSKTPKPAPKPRHEWSFDAIGTRWWIGIYTPTSNATLQQLQKTITQRIGRFDALFSRFRQDSLVSRIAHQAGSYDIGSDGAVLLGLYRRLYDTTDGQVTPLIGQTMADAGYDADYSLIPHSPQPAPSWEDAIAGLADTTLTTRQPVLLDVGAAGKGYLVDILCSLVEQAGIAAYCVDGSGDMRVSGVDAPLRIGLEHPLDTSQVIGVATLQNAALCGSASNRRQWGDYHHIIHPDSAKPVRDIIATWVVAGSAAEADGLATALFFADPDSLLEQFKFSYCIVRQDLRSSYSVDFPATLFS